MSTAEGLASSTLDPEEVAYAGVVAQRALLDAGRSRRSSCACAHRPVRRPSERLPDRLPRQRAAEVGLRPVFVRRPLEWGPAGGDEPPEGLPGLVVAASLEHPARLLDC